MTATVNFPVEKRADHFARWCRITAAVIRDRADTVDDYLEADEIASVMETAKKRGATVVLECKSYQADKIAKMHALSTGDLDHWIS